MTKDYPLLLKDPVLRTIADRHQRSPGQVALRFQLQRGLAVLAKSFTEKHIRENIQVRPILNPCSAQDMLRAEALQGIWEKFMQVKGVLMEPTYPNSACWGHGQAVTWLGFCLDWAQGLFLSGLQIVES